MKNHDALRSIQDLIDKKNAAIVQIQTQIEQLKYTYNALRLSSTNEQMQGGMPRRRGRPSNNEPSPAGRGRNRLSGISLKHRLADMPSGDVQALRASLPPELRTIDYSHLQGMTQRDAIVDIFRRVGAPCRVVDVGSLIYLAGITKCDPRGATAAVATIISREKGIFQKVESGLWKILPEVQEAQ